MKSFLSIGIILHILYFFFSFLALFESNGKQAWQFMIISLILIGLCEMIYIIESIHSLRKNQTLLNIIKFISAILGAIILFNLAYHGIFKTIICNVFMIALLLFQSISLALNKK